MPNSLQPFQGLLPDFAFATGTCTALPLVSMTDFNVHMACSAGTWQRAQGCVAQQICRDLLASSGMVAGDALMTCCHSLPQRHCHSLPQPDTPAFARRAVLALPASAARALEAGNARGPAGLSILWLTRSVAAGAEVTRDQLPGSRSLQRAAALLALLGPPPRCKPPHHYTQDGRACRRWPLCLLGW